MGFSIIWTDDAGGEYEYLRVDAARTWNARKDTGGGATSQVEGLFFQIAKAIDLLADNPRHPSLQTHEYHGACEHPYKRGDKVFEAYAQNRTADAYRIVWCYGPDRGEITLLAIVGHP